MRELRHSLVVVEAELFDVNDFILQRDSRAASFEFSSVVKAGWSLRANVELLPPLDVGQFSGNGVAYASCIAEMKSTTASFPGGSDLCAITNEREKSDISRQNPMDLSVKPCAEPPLGPLLQDTSARNFPAFGPLCLRCLISPSFCPGCRVLNIFSSLRQSPQLRSTLQNTKGKWDMQFDDIVEKLEANVARAKKERSAPR